MKRKLFYLSSFFSFSIMATNVSACGWQTPPLSIDNINKIMLHLQEQSRFKSQDKTKEENITSLNTVGQFTFPVADISYFDEKTPLSDQGKTAAKQFSDALTGLVGTSLVNDVKANKDINGNNDDFYQKNHLKSNLFANYYFTVNLANIKAQKTNAKPEDQINWLYNAQTDSPGTVKDFVWKDKNNKEQSFANDKQAIAEQGPNYSFLNINKVWTKDKIFYIKDKKPVRNIESYQKEGNKVFTGLFLITFAPIAKFGLNPVYFYLQADFE